MSKLQASELVYTEGKINSGMVPIEIASELLQELEAGMLQYFDEKLLELEKSY